jgi:hypothetical protein
MLSPLEVYPGTQLPLFLQKHYALYEEAILTKQVHKINKENCLKSSLLIFYYSYLKYIIRNGKSKTYPIRA